MNITQNIKSMLGQPQATNDPSSAQETERINQEMYKKSAELNERNKTLSLLQKLDAIVLGSITHLNEVAQSVTNLLTKDADFENAAIFLNKKK